MRKTLSLKSYGKINLILDVAGKRPDGYHEVMTILQKIELHDRITLTRRERGIKIICNHPGVPVDERNLTYKVAKSLLEKYSIDGGIEILIDKRIPVASGFGGGSSNAACTLMGLNELFGLSMPDNQMFKVAASIGVDVPFFLQDKPCLATGRGEKLKPFKNGPEFNLILVIPKVKFPKDFEKTKWAYQMADREIMIHPNRGKMIKCFEQGDWNCVARNLGNSLEPVMFKKFPVIKTIKEKLMEYGCVNALMTGAGVGVYGIAKDGNLMLGNMKKYGDAIITKTK